MTAVREFWNEHLLHVVAPAGAALLLGWVLVRLIVEVLVWARARRHAGHASGCTGCGAGRVDVVAYPSRTNPQPYCMPCLLAWPEDGPEPPPMVGLRRPYDPIDAIERGIGLFFAVLTAVLLITWAVGR